MFLCKSQNGRTETEWAFTNMYSWTSPMTNFTLEKSMNTFIMQLYNALSDFDPFSREFIQLLLLFALENAEVMELTMITSKDL